MLFANTWLRLFGLLAAALVGLPVIVLAILSLCSRRPANLGSTDGWLTDCPDTPNCVCSQATRADQRITPIDFTETADEAWQRLKKVVAALPNSRVVREEGAYLHVECTSSVFRFVDDLEFLMDAERHVIHYRSASRVGYSDWGVNRRRLEAVRRAFHRDAMR
ncbi:MAG: DUF1499 domain-containing protein [Pirellulales bacterium]